MRNRARLTVGIEEATYGRQKCSIVMIGGPISRFKVGVNLTSGLQLAEMAWTTDERHHEDLFMLKGPLLDGHLFRACHPLSKGKGLAFLQMNLCEFWDSLPFLIPSPE